MKQYQEAIEKFKEAIKQQPENVEIWCSWGVALVELKQYQEAVGKFQKALEFKPDFVPALYGLRLCIGGPWPKGRSIRKI